MRQRVEDMRDKEVININDGTKIGFINDLEIDTVTAVMTSIIVYGRPRFWGIFGRGDDVVIPWSSVKLIGDDTVLVDYELTVYPKKHKSFFSGLIEIK